jgi:hypothetical protein
MENKCFPFLMKQKRVKSATIFIPLCGPFIMQGGIFLLWHDQTINMYNYKAIISIHPCAFYVLSSFHLHKNDYVRCLSYL